MMAVDIRMTWLYSALRVSCIGVVTFISFVLDVWVTEISVKTGSMKWADTDDAVSITICDASENCWSTRLNKPGNGRAKGAVDVYFNPDKIGACNDVAMGKGDLSVTLEKVKSDGWYVDWAEIKIARGMSCLFDLWLDHNTGYSRYKTVQCPVNW